MTLPTPTVLIVEDNPLIAMTLGAMVEAMGYGVVGPMHNLHDGLDHARWDELDFALLDFDLGEGTDATPIAEVLASRDIPFAFTSATDPAIIRAAFSDSTIIGKPVNESDLQRVLPS